MQELAYSGSASSAVMPWPVALLTAVALGSSSAMCTMDAAPTVCDVPLYAPTASRLPEKAAVSSASYSRPKSDSDLVTSLHDRSGLTWEQLAKAIGVSRRSLHMWAAGSTVTYAHRRVMERFDRLVSEIGMTPEETRIKLLEQRTEGESLLDEFRRTRNDGRREINGPALSAFEML